MLVDHMVVVAVPAAVPILAVAGLTYLAAMAL